MPGQLFVISGPSGAGKSTIVKALRERIGDLGYSISHTSRKPRPTEKNGVDYHFVNSRTFEEMIEKGAFIEWAGVYDDYYGTSFAALNSQTDLGLDVILDLDAQGAKNIQGHFENSVLVYVLPPSLEALETRLRKRAADRESVIATRMEKALGEIKNFEQYEYIIINDDLEKAIGEVESLIMSERCRKARQAQRVRELFGGDPH
ncbi:MAG: guanylate kinase [Deltaproteobacteria bacterium]|nr:guanylate kinase [Deltaproteobacteria bacterium]